MFKLSLPGLSLAAQPRPVAMTGLRLMSDQPATGDGEDEESIIMPLSDADEAEAGDVKSCPDAFDECVDPSTGRPKPGVKQVNGAQGTVWIGCPDPQRVRKTFAFKTMKSMFRGELVPPPYSTVRRSALISKLKERFDAICTDLTPAMNQAAASNSTLLYSSCRVGCADTSDELSNYQLVIDQARANGPTLAGYVKALDAQYSKMNDDQKADAKGQLYCATLQVITAVDTLYRRALYHNDLHAENVILRPLAPTTPLTLPLGNRTISFNASPGGEEKRGKACRVHVAIIDYGLVTRGAPLDRNYKSLMSAAAKMPPLLDLCHFYTSLLNVQAPNLENTAVFDGVHQLLGGACQVGSGNNRSLLLLSNEVGPAAHDLSADEAALVYDSILNKALKSHPPANAPPTLPFLPILNFQTISASAAAAAPGSSRGSPLSADMKSSPVMTISSGKNSPVLFSLVAGQTRQSHNIGCGRPIGAHRPVYRYPILPYRPASMARPHVVRR